MVEGGSAPQALTGLPDEVDHAHTKPAEGMTLMFNTRRTQRCLSLPHPGDLSPLLSFFSFVNVHRPLLLSLHGAFTVAGGYWKCFAVPPSAAFPSQPQPAGGGRAGRWEMCHPLPPVCGARARPPQPDLQSCWCCSPCCWVTEPLLLRSAWFPPLFLVETILADARHPPSPEDKAFLHHLAHSPFLSSPWVNQKRLQKSSSETN